MRLFALSRLAILIGVALVALLARPSAASAESHIETSTSARYPVDAVVVVDCANGGAGRRSTSPASGTSPITRMTTPGWHALL
jgi:hypothetical protein